MLRGELQVSPVSSSAFSQYVGSIMTEVLSIMGHSYAGEITHDVSHYFHQATPAQRLRYHLNSSKALTDPTLEQIMISDHPPFIKRNEDPQIHMVDGLTNLRAATTVDHVGFAEYACAVSQAMRHRLIRVGYHTDNFVNITLWQCLGDANCT